MAVEACFVSLTWQLSVWGVGFAEWRTHLERGEERKERIVFISRLR